MDKFFYLKKVFSVSEGYNKIALLFKECRDKINENDEEEFKKKLIECLVLSEQSNSALRTFIANNCTQYVKKSTFIDTEIDLNNVEISVDDNKIITIKMPIILPFKKVKDIRKGLEKNCNLNNEYSIFDYLKRMNLTDVYCKTNSILIPLNAALEKCLNDNMFDISAYKKGTYLFTNYLKKKPAGIYPDPDNYEYKQIIDCVANTISQGSDNSITIVFRNKPSDTTYTELKVYPDNFELFVERPQI